MFENIILRFIDFPNTKVKSCVTKNEDDTYTIFINAKLNDYQKIKALFHELDHIKNSDFDKLNVVSLERRIDEKCTKSWR